MPICFFRCSRSRTRNLLKGSTLVSYCPLYLPTTSPPTSTSVLVYCVYVARVCVYVGCWCTVQLVYSASVYVYVYGDKCVYVYGDKVPPPMYIRTFSFLPPCIPLHISQTFHQGYVVCLGSFKILLSLCVYVYMCVHVCVVDGCCRSAWLCMSPCTSPHVHHYMYYPYVQSSPIPPYTHLGKCIPQCLCLLLQLLTPLPQPITLT